MAISICLVLIGFFNIMISCMRKDLPKDNINDLSITTEEIDEDDEVEFEDEIDEKAEAHKSVEKRKERSPAKQKSPKKV